MNLITEQDTQHANVQTQLKSTDPAGIAGNLALKSLAGTLCCSVCCYCCSNIDNQVTYSSLFVAGASLAHLTPFEYKVQPVLGLSTFTCISHPTSNFPSDLRSVSAIVSCVCVCACLCVHVCVCVGVWKAGLWRTYKSFTYMYSETFE